MSQGKAQAIGPKDEILAKALQRPPQVPQPHQSPHPLKVVPSAGGGA
jgi:hypothetical protein